MNEGNRIHTIRILVNREIKSTFYGFGFYFFLSVSLLVSSFVLKEYIQNIKSNNILVSQDLLNYPLYISVFVGSLYLALTSTIAIAMEREKGTLQTLFLSPVDEICYILGKYFHQMFCLIIFISISAIYVLLSSVIINFSIPSKLIKLIFLLIFAGSNIISFGIFISSLSKNVKNSVILFITFLIFFFGIEMTNSIFMRMYLKEVNTSIVYIRGIVEVMNNIVRIVSPFSLIKNGFDTLRIGNSLAYNQNLLFSIVYSIFLIIIANIAFKYIGVIKK